MPKINRGTIEYQVHAAPDTPLNLQLGVIYGPRKKDKFGGGFDGYSCVEIERGWFVVAGWGRGRTSTLLETENLMQAYTELATHLGMTA